MQEFFFTNYIWLLLSQEAFFYQLYIITFWTGLYKSYTTLADVATFSTKYFTLSKVYIDKEGIKQF